jgi:NADH:ubiquinone oxidoreductase subunit K
VTVLFPTISGALGLPHLLVLAGLLAACGLFGMLAHQGPLRLLVSLCLLWVAAMVSAAGMLAYGGGAPSGMALLLSVGAGLLALLAAGYRFAVEAAAQDPAGVPAPLAEGDRP